MVVETEGTLNVQRLADVMAKIESRVRGYPVEIIVTPIEEAKEAG